MAVLRIQFSRMISISPASSPGSPALLRDIRLCNGCCAVRTSTTSLISLFEERSRRSERLRYQECVAHEKDHTYMTEPRYACEHRVQSTRDEMEKQNISVQWFLLRTAEDVVRLD